MPSRWFVPVVGVDPRRVKLEHVHAAFTRWFDRSAAEHGAGDKPYTVSPLTRDDRGVVGVEIATLTAVAHARLHEAAQEGASIRLGSQTRPVGRPRLMLEESWSSLAGHERDARWELHFVTPATFRSGDRSSPMPQVTTIMAGLRRAWGLWSDVERAPEDNPAPWRALWVSDIDLRSSTLSLAVRRRDGSPQSIVLSGSLGTLTLRCDDPTTASQVGPLIRLAAFTGVGGMTAKGLGVTRVRALRASPALVDLAEDTADDRLEAMVRHGASG